MDQIDDLASAANSTHGFLDEERKIRHTIVWPEGLDRSVASFALRERTSPNEVILRLVSGDNVPAALAEAEPAELADQNGRQVHRTIIWPEHVERSLHEIATSQRASVNDVVRICVRRGLNSL